MAARLLALFPWPFTLTKHVTANSFSLFRVSYTILKLMSVYYNTLEHRECHGWQNRNLNVWWYIDRIVNITTECNGSSDSTYFRIVHNFSCFFLHYQIRTSFHFINLFHHSLFYQCVKSSWNATWKRFSIVGYILFNLYRKWPYWYYKT